jgi:hypothetical protein
MRDLNNNVDVVQSVNPGAKTATVNGTGVDLQGYEGAQVEFDVGTITDGTHTPKVQESDDNSAWNDVVTADLLGTALVALASNTHQRIGYRGKKRYIRPVSTVAGATTGGVYGVMVVRGHRRHKIGPAV